MVIRILFVYKNGIRIFKSFYAKFWSIFKLNQNEYIFYFFQAIFHQSDRGAYHFGAEFI